MTSLLFDSFKDAQAFAKESAQNKIFFTIKRDGNRFIAELKSKYTSKLDIEIESDEEKRKYAIEAETKEKVVRSKLKQWQQDGLAQYNSTTSIKSPKSNAHRATARAIEPLRQMTPYRYTISCQLHRIERNTCVANYDVAGWSTFVRRNLSP